MIFEAAQVGLRCFLYRDTSFNLISISTASFLRTERTISRSGPSDLQRSQGTNEIRSQVTVERRVEEKCQENFSVTKVVET